MIMIRLSLVNKKQIKNLKRKCTGLLEHQISNILDINLFIFYIKLLINYVNKKITFNFY